MRKDASEPYPLHFPTANLVDIRPSAGEDPCSAWAQGIYPPPHFFASCYPQPATQHPPVSSSETAPRCADLPQQPREEPAPDIGTAPSTCGDSESPAADADWSRWTDSEAFKFDDSDCFAAPDGDADDADNDIDPDPFRFDWPQW
jgi:hypothetical protein